MTSNVFIYYIMVFIRHLKIFLNYAQLLLVLIGNKKSHLSGKVLSVNVHCHRRQWLIALPCSHVFLNATS